jgi:hypothetical protein
MLRALVTLNELLLILKKLVRLVHAAEPRLSIAEGSKPE